MKAGALPAVFTAEPVALPFPKFASERAAHVHPLTPDQLLFTEVYLGLCALCLVGILIYRRVQKWRRRTAPPLGPLAVPAIRKPARRRKKRRS